jgi:hypothetical protein
VYSFFGFNFLINIAEADGLRLLLECWRHDGDEMCGACSVRGVSYRSHDERTKMLGSSSLLGTLERDRRNWVLSAGHRFPLAAFLESIKCRGGSGYNDGSKALSSECSGGLGKRCACA